MRMKGQPLKMGPVGGYGKKRGKVVHNQRLFPNRRVRPFSMNLVIQTRIMPKKIGMARLKRIYRKLV
jgi:hypothetical protein